MSISRRVYMDGRPPSIFIRLLPICEINLLISQIGRSLSLVGDPTMILLPICQVQVIGLDKLGGGVIL